MILDSNQHRRLVPAPFADWNIAVRGTRWRGAPEDVSVVEEDVGRVAYLGFGRIVVSDIEVPNMLANMV